MSWNKSTRVLFLGLLTIFSLSLVIVGIVVVSAASSSSEGDLPPGKQATLDKDATARAEGMKNRATLAPDLTQAYRAIPTSGPTEKPLTGIIPSSEVGQPFPGAYALIQNEWAEVINGKTVIVYAGKYTENPNQGFVAVQNGLPSEKNFSTKEYPTPVKEGSVKITQANNLLLTLTTEKGTTEIFDVVNLVFK